jgi:hypothetical protein
MVAQEIKIVMTFRMGTMTTKLLRELKKFWNIALDQAF